MSKDNYLVLMYLGKILKQKRQLLGLTQDELAIKGRLNRTYICAIENGAQNLSLLKLIKICKTLEIDVAETILELEQRLGV